MKPVVIVGGKKAGVRQDAKKVTVQFMFPMVNTTKSERGEIELINGDVPRIIVKASAQVEVDRFEIEKKKP